VQRAIRELVFVLNGDKPLAELAEKYDMHGNQIT
jgi:hypothetical protein